MSSHEAEELTKERIGENEHERRARELIELLQELRVMLPGVQVLFAFLLTVPFSQGFERVSPLQQAVFFGTLVCTAVSAALLIAPSVHHRILWRQRAREHRLQVANQLAIAGVLLLLPGMVGAIFVITDILFGSMAAAVGTAAITAFFVCVWFVVPIWYRLSGR
jgi:Family of unknown function (DUF6328)